MIRQHARQAIARVRRRTPRAASAQVALECRPDALAALRVEAGVPVRGDCIPCRPGERAAALERMRRAGWFVGAEVYLMLGPAQRQVTVTQRPPVADEELRDALRWQLRDALGYAPEEAVLDPLPVSSSQGAGRAEMIVFASRRSELQAMITDCGKAGIAPVRVSVIDCAQRNLAWHRFEPQKVVALLMPCTGGVLMTVSRGEELILSRAVDIDLGSSDSADAAERIALQIQRTVDVLERRSAETAVGQIVVGYWGQYAALLRKVAELIGPRKPTAYRWTRCRPSCSPPRSRCPRARRSWPRIPARWSICWAPARCRPPPRSRRPCRVRSPPSTWRHPPRRHRAARAAPARISPAEAVRVRVPSPACLNLRLAWRRPLRRWRERTSRCHCPHPRGMRTRRRIRRRAPRSCVIPSSIPDSNRLAVASLRSCLSNCIP
jgi:MSHA biogenesis protein MshI